jgi:hypothetical protein
MSKPNGFYCGKCGDRQLSSEREPRCFEPGCHGWPMFRLAETDGKIDLSPLRCWARARNRNERRATDDDPDCGSCGPCQARKGKGGKL